jgi:hypothetical protein
MELSEHVKQWVQHQDNLENYGNEPPPPDLIEGVLPSASIILLTGEPKSGKSLIVQSWVHSINTGSEWFGAKTQQGGVLYLYPDGEAPQTLKSRFMALDQVAGIEQNRRELLPFVKHFDIADQVQLENIYTALEAEGISLIVLDTMAAAAGKLNLSSQSDVYPFSEFAKQIIDRSEGRTSVLFIMHSPKANPKDISGSTQIKAFGSKIFAITKKLDAVRGDRYTITCTDNRNGAAGWSATFRTSEVDLGEFGKSVVLVEADAFNYKITEMQKNAKKLFDGIPPGEFIPQATLVKTLLSREVMKSPSSAYEWLNKATEAQVLGATGERKNKAFCFPYSETALLENTGKSQTVFRQSPEFYNSGIRNRGGTINLEDKDAELF